MARHDYPHPNALLQFRRKLEHYNPQKASCHQTKYNFINYVKQYLTVTLQKQVH